MILLSALYLTKLSAAQVIQRNVSVGHKLICSIPGMILTLENLFTGRKPGQLVTLSITNPIWADLDSKNGFRNDRPLEENIFRGGGGITIKFASTNLLKLNPSLISNSNKPAPPNVICNTYIYICTYICFKYRSGIYQVLFLKTKTPTQRDNCKQAVDSGL